MSRSEKSRPRLALLVLLCLLAASAVTTSLPVTAAADPRPGADVPARPRPVATGPAIDPHGRERLLATGPAIDPHGRERLLATGPAIDPHGHDQRWAGGAVVDPHGSRWVPSPLPAEGPRIERGVALA